MIGGAGSGLLGVSSGGFLVALVVMVLGSPQYVAQGISLVAQVPPTSLSGVLQYRRSGHDVPLRWVLLLSAGFVVGGVAGALGADAIAERTLRWMYVAYLALLGCLALLRLRSRGDKKGPDGPIISPGVVAPPGVVALLGVGGLSGISSGLLGIGGGLAITALLVALKVPQHRAQALALAVTTLPLTLPAAWVYARQEHGLPWLVIAGVIVGLWAGTIVGARLATFLSERLLRYLMVVSTFTMAGFMAWRACSS